MSPRCFGTGGLVLPMVDYMRKRPFLMALLIFSVIFVLFLAAIFTVGGFFGSSWLAVGEKVAIVEIQGVIVSSRDINERLIRFRDDSQVKAIVLRVNSPGGGVGPSQEIFAEVKKADQIKPVIVSMGSVAASGGYYVAAPARRILANPGTITGSIGVIMEFTNIQELLDKIGLSTTVVKSGEHKDLGSPVRPMSEDEQMILQDLVSDVHGQFIRAVAEGRGMNEDEVLRISDGRIFSGQTGKALGLIDELGNLQDAIKVAAELGGIDGDPKVIYPAKDSPGLLDFLIEQGLREIWLDVQKKNIPGFQFLWSGR